MKTRNRVFMYAVVLLLAFLGFSYWYMIMCEGEWDGVPMEDAMAEKLVEFENQIRDDVAYLSETIGPRNPVHHESLVMAENWIVDRWQSQGYEVKFQKFMVQGKECANLEIEIPGTTHASEIVIVSAQYDTWPESPGANNNAGGMAVLLKLGELIKDLKPNRTLRLVAFTTQEPPYDNTEDQGSIHYARRCKEREEDIRVMLCMDAIGIYKDEPGTQKLPWPFSYFYPDRGNFLAFIADLGTRQYVVETTRGFKRGSAFPIAVGSVPQWVKGAAWSDHYSFWKQGYPGIQITDTGAFRAESHTETSDTMEKMNFEALARITVGMYGSIVELTTNGG